MPATLDSLAADLKRFFAERFPLDADGGPGSVLLVFDNLGRPLSAREFTGAGSAAVTALLSHQRAAELADQIPSPNALKQGWYLPGSGRLSRWYGALLQGSVAAPAGSRAGADAAAFEAAKAGAARSLEQNRLVVVSGSGAGGPGGTVPAGGTHDTYYATSMSPLDWFTPSASGWSTYQVGAADHPPAAAEPPAGPVATPEFTLRVASDPAAEDLAAYVQYAIETEPVPPDWPDLVEVEPPPPDPPVSWEAQVLEALPQLATNMNRTLAVQDSVAAVVDATVPTPVSSRGFAVRFDYCLVRLDRPWWDEIFLSRRDWRLPGYQPGEISNGSASGSGAPVSMVTIGMLVVRDLSITADWSDRDLAALPTSTSLGPFCIAAGGFDSATGTLTRKGLQVIAWLVQIPPVLPPRPARPV